MVWGAGCLVAAVLAQAPPTWPLRFRASCWRTRGPDKSIVEFYYDFEHGRAVNIITSQALDRLGNGSLWDYERSDGLSFYYQPKTGSCTAKEMGFGLLSPDWLSKPPAAKLVGRERIGLFPADKWAKGTWAGATAATGLHDPRAAHQAPFVTYWAEAGTGRPLRWAFGPDVMIFDVIHWAPNETLSEAEWALPAFCDEQLRGTKPKEQQDETRAPALAAVDEP